MLGVGRAQPKEISHPKTIHLFPLGKASDSHQSRVEFFFVSRARIKADPQNETGSLSHRIEPMDESVTMDPIGRKVALIFQRSKSLTSDGTIEKRNLETLKQGGLGFLTRSTVSVSILGQVTPGVGRWLISPKSPAALPLSADLALSGIG